MIDRVLEIFHAGGWVMYPLLVMSFLTITCIVERFYFWGITQRKSAQKYSTLIKYLANQGIDQAAALADDNRSIISNYFARVAGQKQRVSEGYLYSQIELYRPGIERFSSVLGAIIAGAPLLGILGTITGIIQSFDLLGEASTVSDPSLVAGGIAEALYTTAFGLTIAVVALFPHIYFKSLANRTYARLESLAGFINDHSR